MAFNIQWLRLAAGIRNTHRIITPPPPVDPPPDPPGSFTTIAAVGTFVLTGKAANSIVSSVGGEGDPPDPPSNPFPRPLPTTSALALGYRPSYVPIWSLPPTKATGIAWGYIPATAIDFATGDGGGQFATINAWMDACNAADVAGCIGTDNSQKVVTIASTAFSKVYCKRGIYGYGAQIPEIAITWPAPGTDNQTSHTTNNNCWLFGHTHKVTLRGVRFRAFRMVLGCVRRTLPLVKGSGAGGVVSTSPFHNGADNSTIILLTNSGASSDGFKMQRIGEITFTSGSGNITAVPTERQTEGSWWAYDTNDPTRRDATSPNLIGSTVTSATPTSLAAAINARTGTTGISAVVDGQTVIICKATGKGDLLSIRPTVTGNLVLTCNTRGVAVDIGYCEFPDTDVAHAQLMDVTAAGRVDFHKNECAGTWGMVTLACLRWSEVYAANNHQWDCVSSRTQGSGRASKDGSGNLTGQGSRQPSGTGSNNMNTGFKPGTDSAWHLDGPDQWGRYLQETILRIENNSFHDCNSRNATDTNNCAVGIDARGTHDTLTISGQTGGHNVIAWNFFKNMTTSTGAEDCNAIYMKPYGAVVAHNYIENCGSQYVSAGGLDGSEAGSILIKEYKVHLGMPQLLIEDNHIINPPDGNQAIKVDNHYNQVIRYNYFFSWANLRNGVPQSNQSIGVGILRVHGKVGLVQVYSNRFEDINDAAVKSALNFASTELLGTASQLEISNNEWENNGGAGFTAYSGDVELVRFNVSVGNPSNATTYFNTAIMGKNVTKNAAGTNVGTATMRHTNSNTLQNGSNNAATKPFSGYVRPTS